MSPASASSGDPFDALGDQQRRHILRLLARSDHSVAELARELPISRPAVSRHLRVLKEAGLVDERPVGTRRIYRLEAEGMVAIEHYLRQVWGEAGARFRLAAENTDPRGGDD
jgi:DNA-binding transcriptional ArsR family regulator